MRSARAESREMVILVPNFRHGGFLELARCISLALTASGYPDIRVLAMTGVPGARRPRGFPAGVRFRSSGYGSTYSTKWGPALKRCFEFLEGRKIHSLFVVETVKGFDLIRTYGKPLSRKMRIFVTGFALSFASEGAFPPEIDLELPKFARLIDRVICDSRAIRGRLLAARMEKISLVRNPILGQFRPPRKGRPGKIRFLWASRIAPLKKVETVFRLARLFPEHDFDIYGAVDRAYVASEFLSLVSKFPNVRYMGAFNRLESIAAEKYDAFLHTSGYEGVPHILLEAGACGLPVIASHVGGVPEVISGQTGYLARSLGDYVQAIERISLRPGEARDRARKFQTFLRQQYAFDLYRKNMMAIVLKTPKRLHPEN